MNEQNNYQQPVEQNFQQGDQQQPAPQYQQPAPQYQQPAPQYQQPAPQYKFRKLYNKINLVSAKLRTGKTAQYTQRSD